MATALPEQDNIREYLKICSLCNEHPKTPKLLPCQHSFCLDCLAQHQNEVKEGEIFCCPICETDIQLEYEVESLPKNYIFDIITGTDLGESNSTLKCIPCSEDDKSIIATHRCLDCEDTLCQNCKNWHCKFTVTKHHVVVALKELREGKFQKEFLERKVLYCDQHSTDEKKLSLTSYCDHCKCLVCEKCMKNDHQEHRFVELCDARVTQKTATKKSLSDIQVTEKHQGKRICNIERYITYTKQKWGEQETEIYDKATEVHAIIDRIKEEKLAALKEHYEKEIRCLENILNEEKNKLQSFQATVDFTKEFLDKSSDSDFLCYTKDVQDRIELTTSRQSRAFKRNLLNIECKEVDLFLPIADDVFGTMNTKEVLVPHKCKIGPVKRQDKIVDIHRVYGLAIADENIIIAGQNINPEHKICVLDQNFILKRHITCEQDKVPFNVSPMGKDFIVSYCSPNSRIIFILDENGSTKREIRLPDDDQENFGALGITVSKDKSIFITSSAIHKIYRTTQSGNGLKTFLSHENQEDLLRPIYLCMTPKDELVVSNRDSSNIQIYSKEGTLLWQYNGENEGNSLVSPSGVCCDEDGYIYVVDRDHCRIQVIHNRECVGIIPIDSKAKGDNHVPLVSTPDGDLVYGLRDTLVKISFWE